MIGVTCFANQTVGVLGLARSGLSTVRALLQGSAKVWAWDDSLAKRQQLDSFSLRPVDLLLVDPKQVAALVISPGIPTGLPIIHPVAAAMKKANIPIFCDIELLLRMQPTTKRIGITGTNGKSTTTHLIGHILKNAGISAEVGGNIGTPVLDLQPIDGKGVYVLELSSFQLELMETFSFDVGVLLNITPDHLDRHGTMNDYVRIKQHIFLRQQASQTAIIGIDDAYGRDQIYPSLKKQGQQQVIPISGVEAVKGGVYVKNGCLIDDISGSTHSIFDMAQAPALPGSHNAQNAAAAYAACRAVGLDKKQIVHGFKNYPGLAHRQELISTIRNIRFINDSKATNADAAGKALACYQHIYWIIGGKAKEGGLQGLEPLLNRVRQAFIIGEAKDNFANYLKQHHIPYSQCSTLEVATHQAADMAWQEQKKDGVVLLSPACASFDQFRDFEHRGDTFKQIVRKLSQKE